MIGDVLDESTLNDLKMLFIAGNLLQFLLQYSMFFEVVASKSCKPGAREMKENIS